MRDCRRVLAVVRVDGPASTVRTDLMPVHAGRSRCPSAVRFLAPSLLRCPALAVCRSRPVQHCRRRQRLPARFFRLSR